MSQEVMNQIMVIVVIPLLSAVAAFAITWLKVKTEEVKTRMKNEQVNHYIDILNQTVEDVVNATSQTIVDDVKKASEDGKLTKEEAEEIRTHTLLKIKEILGDKGVLVLKETTDDIECMICSKIESCVRKQKN